MSKLRSVASFCADFPDDQIEDETQIVRFGGLAVTEAIAGVLTDASYSVSSPLDYRGEMGWAFNVRIGRDEAEIMVSPQTDLDYLMFIGPAYPKSLLAKMTMTLHAGLAADTRFSNIRWFLKGEFETDSPGVESPLPEDLLQQGGSSVFAKLKRLLAAAVKP